MRDIRDHIISKFKNLRIIADICGVTPGAVSQWRQIPPEYMRPLIEGGKKIGVELKPEDFVYPPKATRKKANRQT
jgi:hypothetical protein